MVFFKGCSLSCKWCDNPECLSTKPQMGFIEALCQNCGKCYKVCKNQAIRPAKGEHRIDYSRCVSCADCRDNCPSGALVRYGESMSVAEVYDAVRRDKMFYQASGGGVTVSGGEPLLWASFVRELFELSRRDGIDTCVETCGAVDPGALLEVAPVTDHFLFDLKHMDSDTHRRYTGQSNRQILSNVELLLRQGADVVFRQPLIPGVNDTIPNIEATAGFLKNLGKNNLRLQLMPYHRMGQSKYRALNMPYPLEGLGDVDDRHVEEVKEAYIRLGISCTISR